MKIRYLSNAKIIVIKNTFTGEIDQHASDWGDQTISNLTSNTTYEVTMTFTNYQNNTRGSSDTVTFTTESEP